MSPLRGGHVPCRGVADHGPPPLVRRLPDASAASRRNQRQRADASSRSDSSHAAALLQARARHLLHRGISPGAASPHEIAGDGAALCVGAFVFLGGRGVAGVHQVVAGFRVGSGRRFVFGFGLPGGGLARTVRRFTPTGSAGGSIGSSSCPDCLRYACTTPGTCPRRSRFPGTRTSSPFGDLGGPWRSVIRIDVFPGQKVCGWFTLPCLCQSFPVLVSKRCPNPVPSTGLLRPAWNVAPAQQAG